MALDFQKIYVDIINIQCALPPSAFVNRPPWNGLEYDLANNEEDEKKPLMTYKANNVKKYPFFSFPF